MRFLPRKASSKGLASSEPETIFFLIQVVPEVRPRIGDTYAGGDAALHFWRTKSGSEVDFVVYGTSGFWALEVKNARRVQPADVRGLASFRADYPEAQPALLYRGSERLVVRDVLCIPVTDFLRDLRPGGPLLP
jgi:hypothetical protein